MLDRMDAGEVVTSVGNSWIICRSKSFAGRIYYFNTLTGEAVWNLSETEVERAKQRTWILQNQPGFAIEDCPEPQMSPESPTNDILEKQLNINQPSHCIVPTKVYNKQIINNCFPKSATLCTSHDQYHHCNSTNPIPFQIPVAPAFNPTRNIASQQAMNLASNNNFDNLYVNMSNTISNRFKRYSEIPTKQPGAGYVNKNFIRCKNYQPKKGPKKQHFNKFNNINNKIDLRLYLSLKKKENLIKEKESQLRTSEGLNLYGQYLDNDTQQASVSPAHIRRSCNFNANHEEEEQVNNDDENWHENLNYKHSAIEQDRNSPHPSLIRRSRSFSTIAGEENDQDNVWIHQLNSKQSDTNQGVSPYSTFNQRRSYGISSNEEGGNVYEDNYLDTYQGDVSILPSSSKRRRSHSFCANKAENDDGENDCYSNQGVVSICPSSRRRRSHSFCANEDGRNDEDNYNWKSNQNNVNPLPSHSKSLNLNAKDNKGNDNTMWIKEKKLPENKNPLERKSLRNLLQTKESSDVLYIVPDSNVFLNNINLLNDILLITEKKFRLLVHQMVINEIDTQTKSPSRALAYRALYFIWQQHEANLAIIIDENYEENESDHNDILHFCRQIIDQDSRLFLLTDDVELYNIADASNIPIVTTARMKQLINEFKPNETTTKNIDISELAKVKITILNDEIIKSPMSECKNPERGLKEKKSANVLHDNDVIQIDKKACDVGVQADSVALTKVTDDIRDDLILPDSTKANDYSPSNVGEISLKYNCPHESSSKMNKTGGKKIVLRRRKPKSTFSMSNDHINVSTSVASASPVTDSTINESTSCNNENLTWGLLSNTSVESLYTNCIEGSQTNKMYKNMNQPDNIMEENSNSVISNTASNVDTESERSAAQKASKVKVAADDRCVIFEVEDDRMEATLRSRSEEWVSRLVQILEEALTQLLQREPDFALESMPPPWTLHEAAECVKKHFQHDADVVYAADKLLQVSRDNGGLRGKIKSNISPHKYMELYSYGLYLIDSLQGILSNNEDLQTAFESMSKLLKDIQHPLHDSFGDIDMHEQAADVTADKDNSQAKVNESDKNKEIKKRSPKKNKEVQSPGKYNLRSQTKKHIEVNREASDKTAENISFYRNIDSKYSFFSSLSLKKNTSNSETETEKSQPLIGLETSGGKQANSPSLQETDKRINIAEETTSQILKGDPIMNEPKIIRTFSKCVEFEEKLKNKPGLLGDSDVSWTYDDEEPGLTIDEEQVTSDYGYQDMDNEYYAELGEDLWYTGNLPEENLLSSTLQGDKEDAVNKTVPFKLLMEKLESNILNAYTSIHNFCVRSSESLTSEDLSADNLSRMEARAEKTSTYINKMCEQLQSVLTMNSQGIFQLLKNKEFAEVSVKDTDMENYRDYISNCLEQGNILKKGVELLVKACRMKARA